MPGRPGALTSSAPDRLPNRLTVKVRSLPHISATISPTTTLRPLPMLSATAATSNAATSTPVSRMMEPNGAAKSAPMANPRNSATEHRGAPMDPSMSGAAAEQRGSEAEGDPDLKTNRLGSPVEDPIPGFVRPTPVASTFAISSTATSSMTGNITISGSTTLMTSPHPNRSSSAYQRRAACDGSQLGWRCSR